MSVILLVYVLRIFFITDSGLEDANDKSRLSKLVIGII